jgi:hypothetical protein
LIVRVAGGGIGRASFGFVHVGCLADNARGVGGNGIMGIYLQNLCLFLDES